MYPLLHVKKALDFAYSMDNSVKEIYLIDPTFNARPDFRDILKLMVCLREKKDLRVHTELRSDLLSEGDIQLFKDAGLVSAEIGLQSVNPEVLALAGRSRRSGKGPEPRRLNWLGPELTSLPGLFWDCRETILRVFH